MNSAAFNVGDIVRLRSGGPKMTVMSLPDPEASYYYYCAWFASDSERTGDLFPGAALELAEKE